MHEVLNDLVSGHGEWQNIQRVVRSTFRGLTEHLVAQQARIDRLESSCAGLSAQLEHRAPASEMRELAREGPSAVEVAAWMIRLLPLLRR